MHLELGEVIVEEILKEKRLGSKGFARIRVNLLLELPFRYYFIVELLFHRFIILGVLEIISFDVLEFRG